MKFHKGQAAAVAFGASTLAATTGVNPIIPPEIGNWILLFLNLLGAILPQLIKKEEK